MEIEQSKRILAIGYYHHNQTIVIIGENMDIEEAQRKKGDLERQIAILIIKYEKDTGTKVSSVKLNSYNLQLADDGKIYGDFDIQVEVKI